MPSPRGRGDDDHALKDPQLVAGFLGHLIGRPGRVHHQLDLHVADARKLPQHVVRLLDELYAMGLHLSIDDFGTGYSSLSALQQFPIGTLKIDQSFVRDVSDDAGDATIVRTIIDMSRSLGMEVVAEGVESVRHLEFLRKHHCHYAQGKLFGEPCSVEELLALLARQASGTPPFAHLLPPGDELASRMA